MIRFSLTIEEDYSIVDFLIQGGVCEPSDLTTLNLPTVDSSKGVVISGRGPAWLYSFLIHHYHVATFVATFDPALDGCVVTSRHGVDAPTVGTVVELPKSYVAYA